MGVAADLSQLAAQRDYQGLENAWESALDTLEGVQLDPFLNTAAALARQDEGPRAAALLGLLSDALANQGRALEALDAVRAAVEATPRPEALRGELVERYRAAHGERPGFDVYLKLSKLEDGGMPVVKAIKTLDDLLDFPVGRFVHHAAGWGVGQVRSVDARTGAVTIDFEARRNHQLPIDGAVRFLQRIPATSLAARMLADLDGLKALAVDAPKELILLTVQSRGGSATSVQIKADLCPRVVPKDQWAKVWARAKKELTHDPLIELSGGSRPTVSVRKAALSFADEVSREIERTSDLEMVYKAGRRLLKEVEEGSGRVEDADRRRLLAAIAAKVTAGRDQLPDRPGLAVGLGYLLEDLAGADGIELDAEILAAREDLDRLYEATREVLEGTTLKRYLDGLRAAHPDAWMETFAVTLPRAEKEVFQGLCRALKAHKSELLVPTLDAIVSASDPYDGALLELAKERFTGRLDDVEGVPSHAQVFERVLAYCDRVERLRAGGHPEAPTVRPRLRALLAAGRNAAVRTYFEGPLTLSMRHAYKRLMASPTVDDDVREVARSVVARCHPEVLAKPTRHHWEDEGVILTTRKGLSILEADFEDIVNNRIPENRQAIGEARAHGDLSENAEYTAALEERDQLVARADRLKKDLEKATLLETANIDTDLVGPGTKVDLIDPTTNAKETYTILGPWDADIERHVISYTAPLAQGLLGRKVGETAEISLPGGAHRTFRVLSIAPAL